MKPFVEMTVDESIATIYLNHAETRNALGGPGTIDELVAALDAVGRMTDVKVLVLTGRGSSFCAGGNLAGLAEAGQRARRAPEEVRNQYRQGIQKIPLAFERLDIPAIAAINGPAIGAGCDLACMCDIRIAAESASFAESFIKLGIVPGDGGAWLLPKIVGLARAYEMSFTGDTIGAAEALLCGLVTRVVPDSELMAAAGELARRIAANSAPALRMTKKLIRESIHARLDTVLELSASFQVLAHQSEEHHVLVGAMLEKQRARQRSKAEGDKQ